MLPGLLFGLALALRLYRLGEIELDADEASDMLRLGLGTLLTEAENRFNPLPQRLLNQLVYRVAGFDVVAVRLLPALFGAATVPVLFYALRRHVGLWVAAAGALLLAVSPAHVAISQMQRSYALLAFTTATMLAALPACRARWLLGLALAAPPWAHYMGFVPAGLALLWVLPSLPRREGRVLAVGVGISWLPLLWWIGRGVLAKLEPGYVKPPALLLTELLPWLTSAPWPWLQLVAFAGCLVLVPRNRHAALVLSIVALTLLAVRGLGESMLTQARYLSAALPALCVLVALALETRWRWSAPIYALLLVAACIGLSRYHTDGDTGFGVDRRDIFRPLAAELSQRPRSRVRVQPDAAGAGLRYYLCGDPQNCDRHAWMPTSKEADYVARLTLRQAPFAPSEANAPDCLNVASTHASALLDCAQNRKATPPRTR